MNWVGVLVVILLAPVVIIGVWLLVILIADVFKDDDLEVGVCACGRRVVVGGQQVKHHGDQMVHSRDLCQPFREWVEP